MMGSYFIYAYLNGDFFFSDIAALGYIRFVHSCQQPVVIELG